MKRTKQVFHREGDEVPKFVSGLRQFDGEDIHYAERMKENADRQRQFIEEQKREKGYLTHMEKEEDRGYAEQTDNLNRMRGMLEDEMSSKRAQMMKDLQEENKRLAREKRDRENQWRNDQERKNQFEIANANNSDLMTENPATTTSQHAQHRYVPYHFKGLTPEQKAQIDYERQQQIVEKKQIQSQQQEEDKMWALQQEANRQLMLQNELELWQKQQSMVAGLKTQAKSDKHSKDQKWTNHYGEQIPLPSLH
ncbi:UNKNOWN [Stylonychia lemnae]|uniref:Protofilament ribbon protein n=1 Tax=Stylonychia lemnae TaxID=5949 RepID=A0A077ZWV0_STYLE|nr:UNKNOWN [Stylonychia lemnae]|eukprot:CDW72971.1 UNKNOWN [Stylonychia lemnae]